MNGMLHFQSLFLVLLVALPLSISADPWQNLSTGDKSAQQFLNQLEQKKKEAGNHPFYKGIPNESKLSDK